MRYKIFQIALALFALTALLINPTANAGAPSAKELRAKVRAYRVAHETQIMQEFITLLAIPNVASDTENIRKNAEHIVALLQRRGIKTQLLQAENSPPVVYGELLTPGAQRTLVVYVHYDGQPVDLAQWRTSPWSPALYDLPIEAGGKEIALDALPQKIDPEWRLYARSTSDDKAPIIALLAALDALRAANLAPSINLKFFFEGEEEAGSDHLREVLEKHKDLLQADAWLLCDGPVHQTRRPLVYFGARGVCGAELTVYGPLRPLHSGHYGNWAPNPALMLARLLGTMRDEDGKILLEGFYDDVRAVTPAEQQALQKAPEVDSQLRRDLALHQTEANNALLVERLMLPALNVRGLQAGGVGNKATNAISAEAIASIDFRLVPEQTPAKVRARLEQHLQQHGYHIVYETPEANTRSQYAKLVKLSWEQGYPPARTAMDLPVSRALVQVLEETAEAPLVQLPTVGGSIPMYLFMETLNAPVIVLPIANHDNNQHAANENIRLQNLWDGIELYAGVIARLGKVWK
ncbi:MAG: M20/M25/M40 family metallo-hydrolase [candidate division KSB1 bacterium]